MRHSHARFSGVDTSCRMPWSAGYITNMFESGHHGAAVVEDVSPRREDVALFDLAAQEAVGCRLHDLEIGNRGFSQSVDFLEPLDGRRDDLGERTKFFEQLLCERLHVAPGYGAKQDQLEHFVIVQRVAAALHESFAQATAMAVVMRNGVGGL